jgi:DNA-binding PadR family transcriptional regulator
MTVTPYCPLALAILARGPRRAHELARALGRDHVAATATLRRLQEHGLVRRRDVAAGPVYQITRRGSAALDFQRLLWSRVLGARR